MTSGGIRGIKGTGGPGEYTPKSRCCPDCGQFGRMFPSYLAVEPDFPPDQTIPCLDCYAKWETEHDRRGTTR